MLLGMSKPKIMGILNVTPDSFSDGGKFDTVDLAVQQAARMVSEGCDLIDVGGESTRPGHVSIDENEEIARVVPVIEALSDTLEIPISIDTTKSSVAERALDAGASILNDIWGLQGDPDMARLAAEREVQVVAMHNRHEKSPSLNILSDIKDFFDQSIEIALGAGMKRDRLILDPGIGFGKTFEQNITAIAHLDKLKHFNLPVLLGLSRKSFLGHLLDVSVDDRLIGTVVSDMFGVLKGADIIRVHDVKPHKEMLTLLEALESA